jgi:hypothetical protein
VQEIAQRRAELVARRPSLRSGHDRAERRLQLRDAHLGRRARSLTELFAVDMLVEDMLAVDMLAVDMGLFPLSMVLGRMTDQI